MTLSLFLSSNSKTYIIVGCVRDLLAFLVFRGLAIWLLCCIFDGVRIVTGLGRLFVELLESVRVADLEFMLGIIEVDVLCVVVR